MKVTINKNTYIFEKDMTILEACRQININIPTLCYLKGVNEIGACRICVVEEVGKPNLITACSTHIRDGLNILTNSKKVINARKLTLELMISNHNLECLNCNKNGYCELKKLCEIYGVESERFIGEKTETAIDDSNPCIVRDNSKCILCNRCVATCEKVQGTEIIKKLNRGFDTEIGSNFNKKLCQTSCVYCGQCVNACPTGALMEHDDTDKVIDALNDPNKHTIVAFAPAVRVAVGEKYNMPFGTNVTNKIIESLKLIGFNKVFDINYGADLTIFEEANELLGRIKNGGTLPMITSCCPGWVNYMMNNHKELIPYMSTCKSPQQMFGALCKTYYAKMANIDPKDIYVVTVMPCIAKKYERLHVNNATKFDDVDAVITTREYIRLLKIYNIDFPNLAGMPIDNPLGKGNAGIFGTSGGVMESALRYLKTTIDKENASIDFKEIRGMKGSKEATYRIGKNEVKVLVVNGLINTRKMIEEINNKKSPYTFIEVMACPGGCINGGGQPYVDSDIRNNVDYKKKRSNGLYNIDGILKSNKANSNQYVKKLYEEFLDKPNSKKAEEILHRSYKK